MPVGYRALIQCVQPLDLRIGITLKVNDALQFTDFSVFKADRLPEQLPVAHDTEPSAPYGFARQINVDVLGLAAIHYSRITPGCVNQKLIDCHNPSILTDINADGT